MSTFARPGKYLRATGADLKITIFGLTLSSSWGNGHATPYRAILRALHRMRHQVTFYERDVDYYRRHRDLPTCDYCNLVLYENWHSVRERALREAAQSDVVMVGSYCPEGARINDDVLALSRPVRVFYDLDTPITLARLNDGGVEYLRREQMSTFDLYLSFTGGEILAVLERDFNVRRAAPLYGCVDPDAYVRVAPVSDFACDLSYMGTHAADRQHKLQELFLNPARRLPNKRFLLAGSLYPWDWQWPANVRKLEHVAPQDHPALFSSSRATLNITRDGMARSGFCPSGRFFEAAACGTPLITDWFTGLDTFFEPGDQVLVVSNCEDALAALSMDDAQLTELAKRARARTLAEHTGECRARELVALLREARGDRTAPDDGDGSSASGAYEVNHRTEIAS